jgi:DNA-binding transcriptional MerR regulator
MGGSRPWSRLDSPMGGDHRLWVMTATLAIGDFSRATHISVKMLRHYHEIGLLEPADVDATTGYRRYAPDQIVTAQVIRRFRDLDMPLDDIHAVLEAPDLETRNRIIASHLARLETNLTRTQDAVASLRNLLEHPMGTASISHRHLPATSAAAITETVEGAEALVWYRGALGELTATLAAQRLDPAGTAGGVFADELFAEDRGEATVFIPCTQSVRAMGRVAPLVVPPADLAIIVHPGSHIEIDRAYGALGAYVTQHALAVNGPLREYYLVGPTDTDDDTRWRTEVGWPIFATRPTP